MFFRKYFAAYRVQLFESRPVSPIFNPHKNVSIVHPEIDDIMQVTFTLDDLDAWLGDPVTLATDEFGNFLLYWKYFLVKIIKQYNIIIRFFYPKDIKKNFL